jgi:hypothetical protein
VERGNKKQREKLGFTSAKTEAPLVTKISVGSLAISTRLPPGQEAANLDTTSSKVAPLSPDPEATSAAGAGVLMVGLLYWDRQRIHGESCGRRRSRRSSDGGGSFLLGRSSQTSGLSRPGQQCRDPQTGWRSRRMTSWSLGLRPRWSRRGVGVGSYSDGPRPSLGSRSRRRNRGRVSKQGHIPCPRRRRRPRHYWGSRYCKKGRVSVRIRKRNAHICKNKETRRSETYQEGRERSSDTDPGGLPQKGPEWDTAGWYIPSLGSFLESPETQEPASPLPTYPSL